MLGGHHLGLRPPEKVSSPLPLPQNINQPKPTANNINIPENLQGSR